MYVGEFINNVRKLREKQNALRKHHRRQDAIDAYEYGKLVDRALEEGITVVTPLKAADDKTQPIDQRGSQ